jgi:hypothetical protein
MVLCAWREAEDHERRRALVGFNRLAAAVFEHGVHMPAVCRVKVIPAALAFSRIVPSGDPFLECPRNITEFDASRHAGKTGEMDGKYECATKMYG